MIENIRDNWFLWISGMFLFVIVSAYGYFCWQCIQTVRLQNASIQLVPVKRLVEHVITQSIDENGTVSAQSVKRILRIRYSFRPNN